MNKGIFKLEELLKESGIPFFFNYREENRPTPFGGESNIDWSKEQLVITIGPPTGRIFENAITILGNASVNAEIPNRVSVNIDEPETDELEIGVYYNLTGEQAFELVKEQFVKHRAEWWPEVYGNEKNSTK